MGLLDTYTAAEIAALKESIEQHRLDHNTLHSLYNGALTDRGVCYVAADGDDGNKGRSWTLPKATVAGAQDEGASFIQLGEGSFDVDESIEMDDGQYIAGLNPHLSFGSVLQATSNLGSDPLLQNTTGNLTSGGLRRLQLRGTNDGDGGVGIYIATQVSDSWTVDDVSVIKFTSHGVHWDIASASIAGNPLWFGFLNCFQNGAGGTGDGIRIERAHNGIVRFGYLGGDDNAGSLLYCDILNTSSLVRVDNLKAERATDGKHDNIVTVNNANAGGLSIGGFYLHHNVSGGTDGNALIKNTGDTSLRFDVGRCYVAEDGSNTYDYGFDDGITQIAFDDFIRRPWVWNQFQGEGMYAGVMRLVGSGSPESSVSAPVGSTYHRTDGGSNTSFYVKESGTGNTGWVAK